MSSQYKNPPLQAFEKYTFTKSSSADLSFSSKLFKRAPLKQIIGGETDEITEDISIGFPFKFCEKYYNRVNISINGFLILRELEDTDPLELSNFFDIVIDPWDTDPDETWKNGCNTLIKEQFLSPGILVCPWFDSLKSTYLTGSLQNQNGEIVPFYDVDGVNSGMTFAAGEDRDGKFFIARWKVYSTPNQDLSSLQKNVLMFEMRLHQGGGIQFSYYPVLSNEETNLSDLKIEGATVGIFINDDGWKFRDLSWEINHPLDNTRILSEFGGFSYDVSYSDQSVLNESLISTPYNSSLVCLSAQDVEPADISGGVVPDSLKGRTSNWPAQGEKSSFFSFSPPRRTRKSLAKRLVSDLYFQNSLPKIRRSLKSSVEGIVYNDSHTINFSQTVDNLQRPVRLQRFYGDKSRGSEERQDLFLGFKIPGTQSSNSPYLLEKKESAAPQQFNDDISVDDTLRSKTCFDIDIPVHHELQMEGRKSAIYYYNKNAKGFFSPNPGDLVDPEQFVTGSIASMHKIPNDWKGFGPTGKNFASSVDDLQDNPELDIREDAENSLNEPWSLSKRDGFLLKKYPESVQNNSDYLPNNEELWEVPIDYPFLLESVTVEIPIEVGEGWTGDKTTSAIALGNYIIVQKYGGTISRSGYSPNCLDFAGPGITFSLFNKISGEDQDRLDLVAKGTLTHNKDVDSNISVRSTWSEWLKSDDDDNEKTQVWVVEPEGFSAYGAIPGCVITPDDEGVFSGVAKVNLNTSTSSGPVVTSLLVLPDPVQAESSTVSPFHRSKIATEFLMTKKFRLPWRDDSKNYSIKNHLRTINSFGRDESGNIVSPRQKLTVRKRESAKELQEIKNPFYLGDNIEAFPKPIRDILDNSLNPDLKAIFHATIPVLNTEESKYLLMPGDKLTLSISKNRPTLFGNGQFLCSQFPKFRHDLSHDVVIKTGNIKIRFHGTLQKNVDEITNPSMQEFRSLSIPDEISNGLVTNQYETFKAKDFRGTYTDHYIFGNLLNFVKNSGNTSALFVEKDYGIPLFSKEDIDPEILYPYPPADQFLDWEDPVGEYRDYRDILLKNRNDRLVSGDGSILVEEIPDGCRFLLGESLRSKRLQPRKELAGTQRTIRLVDSSERIFDSTTPSIKDVFAANITSVFKIGDPEDMFQSYLDLDFGGIGIQSEITPEEITPKTYGIVLFDTPEQFVSDTPDPQTVPEGLINTTWNWTFPFDELYVNARRELEVDNSFVALKEVKDIFIDEEVVTTTVKAPIDHFVIGRFLKVNGENTFNLCIDRNMFRINFLAEDSSESTVGLSKNDLSKILFGFGDDNTLSEITLSEQTYSAGSKYQPRFRETTVLTPEDVPVFDLEESGTVSKFGSITRSYSVSPVIRGWKYGLASGVSHFSTSVFRRGSYGQFRDMLEQRPYTKNLDTTRGGDVSTDSGPVSVKFVDYMCRTTDPLNTWAQNITFDASSTLPYFDGEARNRPPIDPSILGRTYIPIDI